MRVSCSGCRVLRKGCNESCSIRPCLQWIKNPQAQANATVFLAKFYGRAGLINLIDAGPEHLRPAIFRSLLYEACGRMVNPVYGSAGLLWSGSWQLCQAAVEAVLKGAPIMQIPSETAATVPVHPLHRASSYDIRHVAKEDAGATEAAAKDLRNLNDATRTRVKRPGSHCYDSVDGAGAEPAEAKRQCYSVDFHGAPSQVSSGSQATERSSTGGAAIPCDGDSRENETTLSLETVEASMVTSHGSAETGKADCEADCEAADDSEVELELTLGFRPFHHRDSTPRSSSSRCHSRAHSPTCSSSSSAAATAPKESDRSSVNALEGDMLTTDLKLDLVA